MGTPSGLARAAGAACAVWVVTGSTGAAAQVGALASTAPTFAGCGDGQGPPPPGEADCVAREDSEPPDFSWAPRAVLAVPRLAFRTTTEVLMLGARIEDDYQISRHVEDFFFNDARTFGVYPAFAYGTGIGAGVGMALVHKDLAGHREGLRLRAAYASPYRQLYDAKVHSGRLWSPLRPSLLVGYRRDDSKRFYGLGNADTADVSELMQPLPLDAQQAGPAVHTQFRVEQVHANAGIDLALGGNFSTGLLHMWRIRRISSGSPDEFDAPWSDEVFAPESLVGFERELVDAYSELALTWDTRRAVRADMPRALPGAGWRARVWTGVQTGVSDRQLTFGRAGFDVQPFIDLYRGNRILHLRLRGASALGPIDRIPFVDMPSLGGSQLLRGYNTDRYRGRVTLLASAEYRYPVQESIAAYVFTDAGQAWPGFEDMTVQSLADVRVGFGAGVQIYSTRTALLRAQVATSIDGGVFVHLKVNTSDDFGGSY
jgi:Omp85 superfamily domain